MQLTWIVRSCLVPTFYQGILISLPILLTALLLRLCVLWGRLTHIIVNTLATLLGLYLLWWYYGSSVLYFIVLCVVVYLVLLVSRRGAVIGGVCVTFIISCELFIASSSDWHRVRGSFLVMVMKMVSLAFDLEGQKTKEHEDENKPVVGKLPHFIEYSCYCVFPATTIFGPFVTYREHCKFLVPTSLSWSWLLNMVRGLLSSLLCLGVSVCIAPFLFTEPEWNKWLAAYSAAASFRYSHYFVSLLSESSTLAAGIGYQTLPDGTHIWSRFRVVHPVAVELPRSLGTVVTNWNLPMHLFLKNYVFKPSRTHLGRFGAILLTYIASAMLHGLNFQLAAVLLSIGVYAYIESVLRYKLGKKLSACVQDRPCQENCNHVHKTYWVSLVNGLFTLLAMFHLAYLGLMFGGQSEEETSLGIQGYSMMHTLRKWSHLDFLSHWIVLLTYVISMVI